VELVEEVEEVKTEAVDENTLLEELVNEDDIVVDRVVLELVIDRAGHPRLPPAMLHCIVCAQCITQ
jgi:hypothetical protein